MNNFKLIIEYDGTNYYGWQIQPDKITVQGVVKKNLELFLREKINVIGASRTDRGVHARGQVVNFFSETHFSPSEIKNKLNGLLPNDIRIKHAEYTDKNFHARKQVSKKIYKYFIYNNDIGSPFYRYFSWHIRENINLELMNKVSKCLIGTNNFYSFTGQKSSCKTYERTIFDAFWKKKDKIYIFQISGSGFLKNMIRKIVGSLMAINNHLEKDNFIKYLINVQDRKKGKYMAPPQGLFLEEIQY